MASIATKEENPDAGTALIEKFEMATDPDSEPAEVAQPVREDHPSPPPAPKHPAWLAKKAKLAGLDDKEIADLSTDDLKDSLLVASERQRETQERPRDDSGRFTKPEPEPEFSLKDVGLDAERLKDFDPTLVAAMTDLVKPLVAEIKQLKAGMAEIGQRENDRSSREHFDALDQLFAENEAVFGKGKRSRLAKGSEELAKRKAVIRDMEDIRRETPDLGFEEAFEKASKRLFGSPRVEPEPVNDPHGFRNGSVHTPTSRNAGKEPKGVKLAEKNLEARLKERGALAIGAEANELPE